MIPSHALLAKRALERDADGRQRAFIDGTENLEDLRELAFRVACRCPLQSDERGCPFRTLSRLTHTTLRTVVDGLSREECLELFAEELACRSGALDLVTDAC